MNDTIESLKLKIAQLEQENLCLRNLLDRAEISYNEEISKCCSDQPQKSPDSEGIEKYDVNQGARINPIEINDKNANVFFLMFCRGREDVYVLRHFNSKNGKIGYYTQCFNIWEMSKQYELGVKITVITWHPDFYNC